MSRPLLRRLIGIVAAYALALQPVAAASIPHASQEAPVFCSGAIGHDPPPATDGRERACCLNAYCGALIGIAPQGLGVALPALERPTAMAEPLTLAPVKWRYPRSRAPPPRTDLGLRLV
jgi:hypothetical protein